MNFTRGYNCDAVVPHFKAFGEREAAAVVAARLGHVGGEKLQWVHWKVLAGGQSPQVSADV